MFIKTLGLYLGSNHQIRYLILKGVSSLAIELFRDLFSKDNISHSSSLQIFRLMKFKTYLSLKFLHIIPELVLFIEQDLPLNSVLMFMKGLRFSRA